MKGVFGRVLNIDLEQKNFSAERISDEIYKNFLGGKGLATCLLLEKNRPGVDPFSPQNHVVIAVGPACDTNVWGSSRYGIYTRSPLTRIYSESYSGGRVAEFMNRTGYDAFVIRGRASSPTVLEITDNTVKFHDAGEIWGMETYDAQDALHGLFGREAGVIVIGPAGEKLVRFALVENNYWRSAGRTGVGAVLGAKNIKGLAFQGSATKEVAHPQVLEDLWEEWKEKRKDHPAVKAFRAAGTPGLVAIVNQMGGFPNRYWSYGTMDGWENISADALHQQLNVRPSACAKCFMACGRFSEVREGLHKGLKLEGPEYETIYAFGGLCDIKKIDEILYLNDLCDRLGMDTISTGNLAAFAIEASQRHKILDSLSYGDADAVSSLIKKIAYREGIGDTLANGIRYAAHSWGMDDMAIHVKGMEPAGYDPRIFKGMGLSYATADRGACHMRATVFKAEMSGQVPPEQIEGKAEVMIDFEDRLTLQDSLIVCRFYRDLYLWEGLGAIIHGTMGMKLEQEDLKNLAANIRNATQRFNRREGLTRHDDTLPPRFFSEPISGGHVLNKLDFEKMLKDYYKLRGWDHDGAPPSWERGSA
jgi:aldehyde:ferredoxin oxidoreductase